MMGHLQYIMMCMDRSFIINVAIFHKKSPRIVGFDFNGDEPLQYDLPKYRVVIFLFCFIHYRFFGNTLQQGTLVIIN